MEFKNRLDALIKRSLAFEKIDTEEATKTTLILPMLAALGYDIFNPEEVIPEFNADIGTKKGEKVDYAIIDTSDSSIRFIIEAKKYGVPLNKNQSSQLFRYYAASSTRIGILTNGLDYWIFADLDEENKMDQEPFLIFNIQKMTDEALEFIRLLIKEDFNLKSILHTAENIKTKTLVVDFLNKELKKPSKDFVKIMFKYIYPNRKFTSAAYHKFLPLLIEGIQLRESNSSPVEVSDESHQNQQKHDPIDKSILEKINNLISMAEYYIGEVITLYRVTAQMDKDKKISIIVDENPDKMICAFFVTETEMHIGIKADLDWVWRPLPSFDSVELYSDYIIAQASLMNRFN